MPVRILKTSEYSKNFSELPEADQDIINKILDSFQRGERVNIIRLNKILWRLKVGHWRVFFLFEKDIVKLISVDRRTTTTYRKR